MKLGEKINEWMVAKTAVCPADTGCHETHYHNISIVCVHGRGDAA
jgi:hypothetical protein